MPARPKRAPKEKQPPPSRPRSVSRSLSRSIHHDAEDNKWALRDLEHTPEWMKQSPFIFTGYRVGYTFAMALRSFFMIHNESGNVWTHFLGFVVILGATFHLYRNVLQDVWHHHALFLFFVVANFLVFVCSTSYHLLACVSKKHYDVLMAADYFGISSLLVASFIPAIWFAFACHPTERWLYLSSIALLGSLSLVMPFFKFWDSPEWAWRRIGLYCVTAASGLVPAVHTWIAWPPTVVHVGVSLMFLFYGVGVIFFVSKFPESWWPGRFDYAFQSHQIWHHCVTCAAVVHFFTCIGIYERFTTLKNGEC